MAQQLEGLFARLAQQDEHARYEAASTIAKGRTHFLSPALLPYFRLGLTFDNSYVRSFTIGQLAAGSRDPQVAQHLGGNGVLIEALKFLADSNLEIVKNVAALIKALSITPEGLQFLFSAPVLELLRQCAQHQREVVRFRALESAVDIATASPSAYEKAATAGLLIPLHEGLQARDMLERLSCIPLLCETVWGFEALHREGVFTLLVTQAERARELETMITNNIFYLLGRVMRRSPNKELFPLDSLWSLLCASLEDNDPTLNEAAITLCGDILSTQPGAEALSAPAQRTTRLLYLEYMSSSNQVLRTCAFRSLIVALSNLGNSAVLERVVAAIPLPGAVQVNFTYLLMGYLKQPFADIRSPVLGVMKALAAFDWGVKLLFSYPGYPEWLIDRNTEQAKDNKVEKYEIVKAVVQNAFAKANLVDAEYRKLEHYLNQGVFYVKGEAEVAIGDKTG